MNNTIGADYIRGFDVLFHFKNHDYPTRALALLKVASFITVIIPLFVAGVSLMQYLYGRIKKQEKLSPENLRTQRVWNNAHTQNLPDARANFENPLLKSNRTSLINATPSITPSSGTTVSSSLIPLATNSISSTSNSIPSAKNSIPSALNSISSTSSSIPSTLNSDPSEDVECSQTVRPATPLISDFPKELKTKEYYVHTELFEKNPKQLLFSLREYIKVHNELPHITYYTNGQAQNGCDIGGLSKDFFTRLIDAIFQRNKFSDNEINTLSLIHGVPQWDLKQGTEECYQTIGRLLSICFLKNSASYLLSDLALKTGPLFAEKVYDCFLIDDDWKNPSDSWFLKVFLKLRGIPKSLDFLLNPAQGIPLLYIEDRPSIAERLQLNEKDTQRLYYLLDWNGTGSPPLNQNDLDDLTLLNSKISLIVENAKKDFGVKAILQINEGIKSKNASIFLGIRNAEELQKRIEGTVSAEELIKNFRWRMADNVTEENKTHIENYLKVWIKDNSANQIKLENFVYSITGLKSLLPSQKIEIYLYKPKIGTEGRAFASETCFNELKIPIVSDRTQESFAEKIEEFIGNSINGANFYIE